MAKRSNNSDIIALYLVAFGICAIFVSVIRGDLPTVGLGLWLAGVGTLIGFVCGNTKSEFAKPEPVVPAPMIRAMTNRTAAHQWSIDNEAMIRNPESNFDLASAAFAAGEAHARSKCIAECQNEQTRRAG